MKKISAVLAAALLLAGCGQTDSSSKTESTAASTVTTAAESSAPAEDTSSETAATSAPESEAPAESSLQTAPQQEVGFEGMEAVEGSALPDGEYEISVDSSSSMFKIESCTLTVSGGNMSAKLNMSSSGYGKLFMGTAEQAAEAAEELCIPFEDNGGKHSFVVPVEALDKEIACAAYSIKKDAWYDRTLVFRADSLPEGVLNIKKGKALSELALADGEYTVEAALEGGSGKASVQSPAKLTVKDGSATAELVWSSNKYDYMVVGGVKLEPVSTDEFSVFEMPVESFDCKLSISADTTAMSVPHEIEYTIIFDSSTVKAKE